MCEDTVMPWEKHLASNHLSQDTGGWPDVHCEGAENKILIIKMYCFVVATAIFCNIVSNKLKMTLY